MANNNNITDIPFEEIVTSKNTPVTSSKVGVWKHRLLVGLAAAGLLYGTNKTINFVNNKNNKHETTQSMSVSDQLIKKYGFKVEHEKSHEPTLIINLEFHHHEGDMVINNYKVSFSQERLDPNGVKQYVAVIDDETLFTKDKEYRANSIEALTNQVKGVILEKNPMLQESVLGKVNDKFDAVNKIISDETGSFVSSYPDY